MTTNNMLDVTSDKIAELLEMDFQMGDFSPVLILGKAGVGKSAVIEDIAVNQLKVGFKTLRLVDKTELDLIGLPEIEEVRKSEFLGIEVDDGSADEKHRVTVYASNSLLPYVERDGKTGILVIDEITSATSTVQAAIYQLLDKDRSIGSYKLPPQWKVVLIGNGEDDGGTFTGLTPALLNRVSMGFRMEPDMQVWKDWAASHGVHPTILAYLHQNASKIHSLDVDADSAEMYASPRSWTLLSAKIVGCEKILKQRGKTLTPESVEIYACGAVGKREGIEFANFYRYSAEMEDVELILQGKAIPSNMKGRNPAAIYITIENLAQTLKYRVEKGGTSLTKETRMELANAVNWIIGLDEIRTDLVTLGLRDISVCCQVIQYALLMDFELHELIPEFSRYADEHKRLFGGE